MDKVGGVVILDAQVYELEYQHILNDIEHYDKIEDDPFKTIEDKFNKLLNKAKENKRINPEELKFIKIENPCRPHLPHT